MSTSAIAETPSSGTELVALLREENQRVNHHDTLPDWEIRKAAQHIEALLPLLTLAGLGGQFNEESWRRALISVVVHRGKLPEVPALPQDISGDERMKLVSPIFDVVTKELKGINETFQFLLDHVVPPEQWPGRQKTIATAEEAVDYARAYLQRQLGEELSLGAPEHFYEKEGWRVPLLDAQWNAVPNAVVKVYKDGNISPVTRGALRQLLKGGGSE